MSDDGTPAWWVWVFGPIIVFIIGIYIGRHGGTGGAEQARGQEDQEGG